jgi:hypothetical protein
VVGENRERLPMGGDEALSAATDQVAHLIRTYKVEAAVLQLLNKD